MSDYRNRRELKHAYHDACVRRQALRRLLTKEEGLLGLDIWNDSRMLKVHEECEHLGTQWREWKDEIIV